MFELQQQKITPNAKTLDYFRLNLFYKITNKPRILIEGKDDLQHIITKINYREYELQIKQP